MNLRRVHQSLSCVFILFACLFVAEEASAQLFQSAFRVLGQPDLRQNGLNGVEGEEMFTPNGLVLDLRGGELHLYVADTLNNRVLGWRNAFQFENGATADLVLGQRSLRHTVPLGIGDKGLRQPVALAVDRASGDLFVADSANHRIVRFASPFENPGRIEPDLVYGQLGFAGRSANFEGVSERTLNRPAALALDRSANLWVADSGNHRVLRYAAADLEESGPRADLVLGQVDFLSNFTNGGPGGVKAAGFNAPSGVAFHPKDGSLWVSDASNSRILIFEKPEEIGQAADRVLGQPDFTSRAVPPFIAADFIRAPTALSFNQAGDLFVALPVEHRILIFDDAAKAGQQEEADRVLGQPLLTIGVRNVGTDPRAGAEGLAAPGDVAAAPNGDVFVVDSGNHRVLVYPGESGPAERVLGQPDFTSNGANRVGPASISAAYDIAIDYSRDGFPIYVSDTLNNRVLAWRSSLRLNSGAPADLVIGQADFSSSIPNADTGSAFSPRATSLAGPRGIDLSPEGDLWVADSGNNRVLRFPAPFDQPAALGAEGGAGQAGRITADVVLGQRNFLAALSAAVSAVSLRSPSDVVLGADGRIFVSDTGNNRVLQYPPNPSNGAAAIRVFGQADFVTDTPAPQVTAQSLINPEGIHFDPFNFLYVAESAANRVLVFPVSDDTPSSAVSASTVIGQATFDRAAAGAGSKGLNTPRAVTTDSEGLIFIADSGNNRIVVYPSILFLPISDAEAEAFLGQPSFTSTRANFNTPDGLATPQGLFAPLGLFLDRNDTLYVGDTGNNRVAHFLKPAVTVSAATFVAGVSVSPGSLVSLFGLGLAEESAQASSVPLPKDLANRIVETGEGLRAALLFASEGQFNFQVPIDTPSGLQGIAVRIADTDELLAGGPMFVSLSSPGLFTVSQSGQGAALALNENGSINGPANPAPRGSVVVLFGTGQGPTDPSVGDGQPAPAGPLAETRAVPRKGTDCITMQPSVCVAVGSKFGEVLFSGLAPGFVGLWQLNVRIPEDAIFGDDVPIRVLINQRASNNVTLSIR